MDPALSREVLARLPLAEAVLTAWRWMADDAFLDDLFERHRGRCYVKAVRFPVLVAMLHDVIAGVSDSANQRFVQARASGEMPAHPPAAYEKLARLPIALSSAFLAACTVRLRQVIPDADPRPLHAALAGWAVLAIDGKAIKHVAKRLKPLRDIRGGLLAGRALIAQDVRSGLAVAMHADPDGEANEVRLVPDLLPAARAAVGRPVLWVADRQFGFPDTIADIVSKADRFLIRHHGAVHFAPDPNPAPGRSPRTGADAEGRAYREEWGWLGAASNAKRRYVRRIDLDLGDERLALVTDLLDAKTVPAADLLGLYRRRWGIESAFQEVTEVFGLARLIGGAPRAAVFQLSFCLVMHNLIRALKGLLVPPAPPEGRPVPEVSGEKVFREARRQLIGWRAVLTAAEAASCFEGTGTAESVRARLAELMARAWKPEFAKAKRRKKSIPHPPQPFRRGEHQSVHRVLDEHKKKRT